MRADADSSCTESCTDSWRHWLGSLCAQAARRTLRSSCCATNSLCCAARSTDPSSPTPTGPCSQRSRLRYRDRAEPGGWSPPTHCCAGTAAASPDTGPNHSDRRAGHRHQRSFADSHCVSQPRIRLGDIAASMASSPGSATASLRPRSGEILNNAGIDPVGAGNSAVVVDVPRCGPMLSPRVPNLVPIPGITGSARCAVRPLEGPRDRRVAPPTRCAAPTNRPPRAHRRRPELARGDRGRARATEPSRVAGHPRHAVALAPAPHRRALDPTTATAGPTIDLSRDSPTRTAPRSRESDLGLPPHPRRTRRARPPPRCIHGLGRSSTTPESTPHPHARKSPGRSSCGPRPPSPATSPPSTPSRCAGSTCCSSSTSLPGPCTSQGSQTTPAASGPPKPPGTCSSTTPTGSLGRVHSCATAAANSLEHSTRSSEPKAARSSKHQCAPPWRTRSPNAGSAPFDASSSTAPSSGTAANSTILSSTTSITTTRTGPTVHSTSNHPSPPTHQTSQTDTSKS